MRYVAQSHRIACRNPHIDTGVRAEIAEVAREWDLEILLLAQRGQNRVALGASLLGEAIVFCLCYRFRGVASWKHSKIYPRPLLARVFFGAAIGFIHA